MHAAEVYSELSEITASEYPAPNASIDSAKPKTTIFAKFKLISVRVLFFLLDTNPSLIILSPKMARMAPAVTPPKLPIILERRE